MCKNIRVAVNALDGMRKKVLTSHNTTVKNQTKTLKITTRTNSMRRATQLLRNNTKLLLVALLAVSVTFVVGGSAKVSAADCDENAIVYCGTGSASTLIDKVKANNDGHGHHDLQPIYAHYGLVPADYSRYVSTARPGTAYKDGRIVVDGQIVATGTKSIGRLASFQGPGYFTTAISGAGTYYGNINSRAFGSDSLPVMVMFNSKGAMEFAVLTNCGNPIYGTPATPTYSCDALHSSLVSGKPNTYSFTTAATATNNAKLVKVVYNFGDGTTATSTSLTTPVVHAYAKAGTYNATVTVYVSLPGNQTITVTSVKCATVITIKAPFFSCIQLTGAILDKSKYSYSFTATANYGNGATFTGADFNFGDSHSANGVAPTGTSVSTSHMYATAGNYRIVATLHFNVNGVAQSATCSATITPTQPPTPECKPGVPQGSALCTPCQEDASLPADSPKCIAPATTLPNTGAGDVIAIFGAVVVAGFLIFRQFIYRRNAVQTSGAAAMTLTDHPQKGDTVEPSVDTNEPTLEQQVHRNQQGLNHTAYHRPHRFRPRSHNDQ